MVNILLIHTDQHRVDCLGAYGNKQISTPNIDVLADDGVRYDNSFCSFPICTPSRYSLLTGLYCHEHRANTNYATLLPGTATFPAMLRDAGYRTKTVGKMHFTPTYFDVGFDEMELVEQEGDGRWADDYHRYLREKGLIDFTDIENQYMVARKGATREYWDSMESLVSDLPDEHHSTTWIGDRAVETIENWQLDSPSLLTVGFVKPHHPFDPPIEWAEKYDPDDMKILPGWTDECFTHDIARHPGTYPHTKLTKRALRIAMACYYATITHLDYHVGRMVDVLKRRGIYDNTMIIFTSDHGDYLGFHHMLLKSNHMYDPLMKVPLIIKYPGNVNAGEANDSLVSNIDVAPTVLPAADLSPTPDMTGYDLSQGDTARDILFAEGPPWGDSIMARTQTRKLILIRSSCPVDRKPLSGLMFDMENDPLEMNDVYNDPAYASDRKEISVAIESWFPHQGRYRAYVNENAPQITQPNVPPPDRSHRSDIIDYYARKFKECCHEKRVH